MKRSFLLVVVVLFIWNSMSVFAQQKISKEEENAYQSFLQETSVILKPYQRSISLALSYRRNQNQEMLFTSIYRGLNATVNCHIGLPKGIEAYLSIPISWEEKTNQDQFKQKENKNTETSIGNLSLGTKFMLFRENGSVPSVIGSLGVEMPTKEKIYPKDSEDLELEHWLASAGLTILKSCDPVIIYTGLSYTYSFADTSNGHEIQPGDIIGYDFGMAFMINDKITIGEEIIGSYQTNTIIDSEEVLFSSSEPMALRNSLTYAISKDVSLEPSVVFGLNDDANDILFNLSYNRRF